MSNGKHIALQVLGGCAIAGAVLLVHCLWGAPIDSLHYGGLVNNITRDGECLFAATDSGVVDLECGNWLCREPMNALSIYQDFLWTVSVAGTLRQRDLDGNEYFHCKLAAPDNASEVQVSLCYPTVLFNLGGHYQSGLWQLEDCNRSEQHLVYPIGAARLRGLIYDEGHYWVGEWQTCEIHRLSIQGDWAFVDSTINYSDYGERLEGFTGESGDWWVALQRGDSTVIYRFCEVSDTKRTRPMKPLEFNLWPNPATSLAQVRSNAMSVKFFNILGRRMPQPYGNEPNGRYIGVANRATKLLTIVR